METHTDNTMICVTSSRLEVRIVVRVRVRVRVRYSLIAYEKPD